jgi:hypothetical protein
MEKNQRRTSAGRTISFRSFDCGAKEIFRILMLLQLILVAEFTNEAGKSFKAKLLKISILKKEAEDFK